MKLGVALSSLVHRRWFVMAMAGLILVGFTAIVAFRPVKTASIDSFAACAADGNPITESDPPVCHDGKHYFVGTTKPAPTSVVTDKGQASVPFDLLVQGDSGGSYGRMSEVIRDDSNWQAYWGRVHEAIHPIPPILPVNFLTHDVVAISEGVKTTNGYDYRITGVSMGEKGSVIDVTESIPTTTCPVKNIPTNRYFIVRTVKLTDPVSFRITTDYRRCD